MFSLAACDDTGRIGSMPAVFPVSAGKDSADRNEQTPSYSHALTHGMSYDDSQVSSRTPSYAADTCYTVETPVPTILFPGHQERAVERQWRALSLTAFPDTVEERNKMVSDIADFICEVSQN